MQRSQRAFDNPALAVAVRAANELGLPTVVFFAPVPFYPHANARHYAFLEDGIADIAAGLTKRDIGFVLRRFPEHSLLRFCEEAHPALVVGDENPLRETQAWRQTAAERLHVPLWIVDSDVIVPSSIFLKQEYAAYTIRPKLRAAIPDFLVPIANESARIKWQAPKGMSSLLPSEAIGLTCEWNIDRSVGDVRRFWRGGTSQALVRLKTFVRERLAGYPEQRNHPETAGTSGLSPYLHFGHMGPHTIALAVQTSDAPAQAKEALLEELIVRRELAVNFVTFNPHYDSLEGAPSWALRTLQEHARDEREHKYSAAQLEDAATHDPLWNAAQRQMVITGWMHNYMRMYWAKKILEWSPTPAEAHRRAISLNDKYELDGRDPNSYEGISWAIAGKSDRAWFDRPIFGKVRYMSYESTRKKFNSKQYIAQIAALEQPSLNLAGL